MCRRHAGGGALARTASNWRDWQATKKQVHGRKKGLQKTDRAESWASVRSEVHFVGVGAGRQSWGITVAWRTRQRAKKKWRSTRSSISITDVILYWEYIHYQSYTHMAVCKNNLIITSKSRSDQIVLVMILLVEKKHKKVVKFNETKFTLVKL